jgi:hypothetical protein
VKKIIAATFVLAAASSSAWAQPTKGAGTFTIAGVVNTQLPQNGQRASANGMFTFGLGTFVGSHTQLYIGPVVNLSAGGGISDPDSPATQGSSVHASLGATVAIKQLFGSGGSKTFPYVGLHAQVLDFGSGGPSFSIDANGEPTSGGRSSFLDKMLVGTTVGLKSYFKENVALDLSAQMGAPVRNLSSGLRNVSVVAAIEYLF